MACRQGYQSTHRSRIVTYERRSRIVDARYGSIRRLGVPVAGVARAAAGGTSPDGVLDCPALLSGLRKDRPGGAVGLLRDVRLLIEQSDPLQCPRCAASPRVAPQRSRAFPGARD